MIQAEVRHLEEEEEEEVKGSGTWITRWEITWPKLCRLEPFHILFLLRTAYDTFSSPTNLHRWGKSEDPLCRLCGGRGTMAHILAGCKTALSQGRYRLRHDKVLFALERERLKERQTNERYAVCQGRTETTNPQEDQDGPSPSSTYVGDESGPGEETSLTPVCANIAEARLGLVVVGVKKDHPD